MNTRDEILNAFEELIIEQGERSATISGVAAAAGVSKGGLLYHFGSKDALVAGLADRFNEQVEAEVDRLREIDDPVEVFLRESLEINHPTDRTFIALIGLAQLGEHQIAKDALAKFDTLAWDTLADVLGDRALAHLVLRVSDGLYLRAALSIGEDSQADFTELMGQLRKLLPKKS